MGCPYRTARSHSNWARQCSSWRYMSFQSTWLAWGWVRFRGRLLTSILMFDNIISLLPCTIANLVRARSPPGPEGARKRGAHACFGLMSSCSCASDNEQRLCARDVKPKIWRLWSGLFVASLAPISSAVYYTKRRGTSRGYLLFHSWPE